MSSINESIVKLQEITQQNLEILKALNDSFFTKRNHLSVEVSGQQFKMPSFISLENKINVLAANLENLIHAPETGEAYFNMDGNSRSIEVRPYTQTPNSLVLGGNVKDDPIKTFNYDRNDVFKDFLTPTPYVKIATTALPNDITKVIVKKVIPLHSDLKNLFNEHLIIHHEEDTNKDGRIDPDATGDAREVWDEILTSTQHSYKNLAKVLKSYKEDKDYVEYDTVVDLPIRKNIGSGVYVIEKIIEDVVDNNLDNFITLKFRTDMNQSIYMNKLYYRLFDEMIEKPLRVGDTLTTFEGNAKVQIVEIMPNINAVKVKVLYGEYLNLVESPTNNHDQIISLNKLKFDSPINFDEDKYVKVPLEEDEFVFISIAALNSRMNVQSPWGTGLMMRTSKLTLESNGKDFQSYYKENVKNIGDILNELTILKSHSLTKQNPSDYLKLVRSESKPVIDPDKLVVTQINSHLNNAPTIQNIRALYEQKKQTQASLAQTNESINEVNQQIEAVPSNDVTGLRAGYEAQLNELLKAKNDLTTAFESLVRDISLSVNEAEIPIENAKFRIRGYFDYESYLRDLGLDKYKDNVSSIHVQYRYKNANHEYGNAISINDFIFSDWIEMTPIKREKYTTYNEDKKAYSFEVSAENGSINEPSFNQIDIPITQGETVDIRLQVLFDFGDPFAQTKTAWSDIVNIQFPIELTKNVQILDIISENNDDIRNNHVHNILKNEGITRHIDDQVINDKNEIFYHNPKHIPSGFLTNERQIIPLEDKLKEMQNTIDRLIDEVVGVTDNALQVSVKVDNAEIYLEQNQITTVTVEPYPSLKLKSLSRSTIDEDLVIESGDKQFKAPNLLFGTYNFNDDRQSVSTVLNIMLKNTSNHDIKLYPMFPGDKNTPLNSITRSKFDTSEYCNSKKQGVYCAIMGKGSESALILQRANQFINFRIKDAYTGEYYYGDTPGNGILSWNKDQVIFPEVKPENTVAYMYPILKSEFDLTIPNTSYNSFVTIKANQYINIPIALEYYTDSEDIIKYMSFDLRTSLYNDPLTFTFAVPINHIENPIDKIVIANMTQYSQSNDSLKFTPTKLN